MTIIIGSERGGGRGPGVSTVRRERSEKFRIFLFDTSSVEPFRFLELRVDVAVTWGSSVNHEFLVSFQREEVRTQ